MRERCVPSRATTLPQHPVGLALGGGRKVGGDQTVTLTEKNFDRSEKIITRVPAFGTSLLTCAGVHTPSTTVQAGPALPLPALHSLDLAGCGAWAWVAVCGWLGVFVCSELRSGVGGPAGWV